MARTPKRPRRRSLSGTKLAATLLSNDDRGALERIASAPRPVRAGADLVREGGTADHLHFMVEGWAVRFKTTREGGRQIVGLAVPDDMANLDSLLFTRLDYGVRAITAASVVSIPRERLTALAAERPGIAQALTWSALVENAILSQWAFCLGRHTARQRLAHLLCELAVRLDGDGDAVAGLDLPMTQEHLGDTLGLTPIHVNRTMQQLRADGLIVVANRSFTIPDAGRLRQVGCFDPAYLHVEGKGS